MIRLRHEADRMSDVGHNSPTLHFLHNWLLKMHLQLPRDVIRAIEQIEAKDLSC